MKSIYRINVRFDLNSEEEKEAAEYLKKLSESGSRTRNSFIVDAVIEAMRRQGNETAFSLDDIREMFREELKTVSFVAESSSAVKPEREEMTEDQKKANEASDLSALAMFD